MFCCFFFPLCPFFQMMCHPNYKFTCDIRINWDGIDQKKQKPSHWIKDQWAYEQRRLALSAPVFDTCLIRFLSLIARCCQCVYCTRVKNTGDVTISSHLMNNVQSEIKLLCKYCWCFFRVDVVFSDLLSFIWLCFSVFMICLVIMILVHSVQ